MIDFTSLSPRAPSGIWGNLSTSPPKDTLRNPCSALTRTIISIKALSIWLSACRSFASTDIIYCCLLISRCSTPQLRSWPRLSPASDARDVSIPLRKRNVFTLANGVFDKDKAAAAAAINKHSQNLKNLVNNIGAIALPKGAVIKSRATISRDVEERLQRRQVETLTDLWAGSISIGTPAQQFIIDFETTNSLDSSTAKQQTGTFQIQYGDDSEVSGPVFTDTVSVAVVKATNQYFSPAKTVTGSFSDGGVDGILGMTCPNSTSASQFGFYLAQAAPSCISEAPTRASTVVTSSPTISTKRLGSGKSLAAAQRYGPPDVVAQAYGQVPGLAVFHSQGGLYSFPWDTPPKIAFNWGGNDWVISAANINLGLAEEGSSQCVGALAGQDIGLGSNVWLLGDSFMKNVYSVFDFDANTFFNIGTQIRKECLIYRPTSDKRGSSGKKDAVYFCFYKWPLRSRKSEKLSNSGSTSRAFNCNWLCPSTSETTVRQSGSLLSLTPANCIANHWHAADCVDTSHDAPSLRPLRRLLAPRRDNYQAKLCVELSVRPPNHSLEGPKWFVTSSQGRNMDTDALQVGGSEGDSNLRPSTSRSTDGHNHNGPQTPTSPFDTLRRRRSIPLGGIATPPIKLPPPHHRRKSVSGSNDDSQAPPRVLSRLPFLQQLTHDEASQAVHLDSSDSDSDGGGADMGVVRSGASRVNDNLAPKLQDTEPKLTERMMQRKLAQQEAQLNDLQATLQETRNELSAEKREKHALRSQQRDSDFYISALEAEVAKFAKQLDASKASYSKLQNQYIAQCRQSEDYRHTIRDSDAAVYELRQAAELTRIEIARYAQEKEEQEEQLHRIPHLEAEVTVAQARLDEQKQEIILLKATIDRMQVDIDDMDRNEHCEEEESGAGIAGKVKGDREGGSGCHGQNYLLEDGMSRTESFRRLEEVMSMAPMKHERLVPHRCWLQSAGLSDKAMEDPSLLYQASGILQRQRR
ncbi:hypothetical protein B0H14DRAFT_2579590 [Mycena olivaceomarginata]|nr:hypothetical protein B0H14DRAFT_2579590 [Mycena olivaceomarginata]